MGRLFGTDGVRGVANADLTPELAMAIGRAAAGVLLKDSHRPSVVIGRDGRASGEMLEGALAAGLASAGAEVMLAGVLPTPAVAFLACALGADVGAAISASHNPVRDNGIKFFGEGGFKLPDAVEEAIEAALESEAQRAPRPMGAEVGRIRRIPNPWVSYINHVLEPGYDLSGMKIAVDCANGAASRTTPEALRTAGAEVFTIHDIPDGANINAGCGSTHPEGIREFVKQTGSDVGLAHDGDADRLLAVDEQGELVDGDQILALCAMRMREQGRLPGETLVTTVMANLGFHRAMARRGIKVLTTPVGDRYVLEAMREGGYNLGGEQSGHLIFLDRSTTGDGLVTALELLAVLASEKRPFSEVARVMDRFPQVLINVRVAERISLEEHPRVGEAIAEGEAELGQEGRVLVRPSGTEPLVRVMVEAATQELADSTARRIADVVVVEMGGRY
ncbi:MAG: phosphoglucosamine mutase [Actinomycetota bacterium]